MKTIVQTSALITSLFLATAAQAQNLHLNPQPGQVVINFPINIELADSGANGAGQAWDFSAFIYDNNTPETWLYRLPATGELTDFPQANLAADSETEGTFYYNVSADSLAYAGRINSSGPLVYSNLQVDAVYPFNEGETYYDTARYAYYSGSTLVDVRVYAEWVIVGNGSLATPLDTYASTWKVRRTGRLEFYANNSLVQVVHTQTFDWYSEDYATELLHISYDDYNDVTEATVLAASGEAGLEEAALEQVNVFPNPASGAFEVTVAFDRYTLIDATGRTVKSGDEKIVDIQQLPEGHYTLYLYLNGAISGRTQVVKNN